jgi:hypothetical protein
MASDSDEAPTAIELLIIRNQRALLRALVASKHFDEPALITQGQETYDFLKRHDGLGGKKK